MHIDEWLVKKDEHYFESKKRKKNIIQETINLNSTSLN